jgi:glycosyltransferase involved in cell wall biosynthesis
MLVENDTYPADVRVRNEAEALLAAGYRVTVLAPNAEGRQARREYIDGVEVVRFRLPATAQNAAGFILEYAVAHLQLARLTLTRLLAGADILHVNNPPDTLGLLLVLARLLGRRAVFDNHDLFPELFALRYGSPRLTRLLRVFQRLAFRQANLVLTTNESQREVVIDAVGRDPESVVVVRNGPRAASTGMSRSPLGTAKAQGASISPAGGTQAQTAPSSPVGATQAQTAVELLFLGALEPQDGVETLADVLQILVNRHGLDARLTVVGAGSCRSPLEIRCSELGLGERLVCTGRVSHKEVPSLLARADVCVDPAPCNELNHRSTMMKIAEYMAAGKPIVAFDLRETRRTADGAALYAACGDVDDFAERIAELAASGTLSGELARKAEQRLPQLVWERSAEALVTAYALLFAT